VGKYTYFPARCVFSKPFCPPLCSPHSYCCFPTFKLPRVHYSGNIMCVTLMCLRLFNSVVPGTQDHYRFFHILYILSITNHSSIWNIDTYGQDMQQACEYVLYIYIYTYVNIQYIYVYTHTHTKLYAEYFKGG